MGSLVVAGCSNCGLSQELALGGGFMDFTTTAAVPAGCTSCRRLVLVNALGAKPRSCPTDGCAGLPQVIGELRRRSAWGEHAVFTWVLDDRRGAEYVLRPRAYSCPACEASTLTFRDVGCWD